MGAWRGRLSVTGCLGLAGALLVAPHAVSAQHLPSARELEGRVTHFQVPIQGMDRERAYQSGWTARAARPDVRGTLRTLVVPVLFADSPEPVFSTDDLKAALFDGPNPQGTVSELYDEMSLGVFHLTGTVTPWYRSSMTLAEVVGGDLNNGEPARTGYFLLDIIEAVDADLDLGQFDNDGPDGLPNSGDDNGTLDSVFFLYSEVGAHCGGLGPWPHFGGLSPWNGQQPYMSDDPRPGGDPVRVDPYVLSTVVDCAGTSIGAAPVAAHELGHVIGLPDFYQASPGPGGSLAVNRKWILGCWDLMAGGAWGCGPADEITGNFGPAGFSPYNRHRAGWLDFERAEDVVQREYLLEPVQTSGHVLQVPLGPDSPESFLVEYRPQLGFDRVLPASGVMIYHWDESGVVHPRPEEDQNYLVTVVEADDNASLQRTHGEGGNRGEAGDAWAIDGAEATFSALTTPAPRTNAGAPAPVTFHSIRIEDGVARIRLSSRVSATVVGADALPEFRPRDAVDLSLPVGGGVLPYTLQTAPDLPVGVTASLEGDALQLDGEALATGVFESSVGIRDAVGTLGTTTLRFVVAALNVARARLLAPFLLTSDEPLAEDEIEILDNSGNRNGVYDVGDLRAQLVGG